MKSITYQGVRGSLPTSKESFSKYGHDTSCVSIELDESTMVILDAGTGIYKLGQELAKTTHNIYILLSHYHWDHIQGLPFFTPLYQPNRNVTIVAGLPGRFKPLFNNMMDGIRFPIKHDMLQSNLTFWEASQWDKIKDILPIEKCFNNHPGGALSFKVTTPSGKTMVYCSDNELSPLDSAEYSLDHFRQFFEGVDVLIHDTQYIEEDRALKTGWGHSFLTDVLDLAHSANVKSLVLYHHDPEKSDVVLESMLKDANEWIANRGATFSVSIATEDSPVFN